MNHYWRRAPNTDSESVTMATLEAGGLSFLNATITAINSAENTEKKSGSLNEKDQLKVSEKKVNTRFLCRL